MGVFREWVARWWHSGSVLRRLVAGPIKLFVEIWPPVVLASLIVLGAGGVFYSVFYPVDGYVETSRALTLGGLSFWATIALGFLYKDWCFWTEETLEATSEDGGAG